MDERSSASSSVSKLSADENNIEVVLNPSSPNDAALQNISSKGTSDSRLLCLMQGGKKGSLEPCSDQEKEMKLLQLSSQLPCCSTTEIATDFTDKIVFDPNGLFIPWELYCYMGFDLLRPLAKLQTLQNMNLYHAIRNELRRRGKNGGLEMLDIAREIAVPGYFREIRALWNSYSDAVENDFEFAFIRIISFLHWANVNIHSLTDLGPLNVEKLMLCYNCRWGETSTARKRFDSIMRQILFDMKDLLALRSWCGVLREKTVIDLAMIRAEYLTVLDLGTMVAKGPFKKWNLKELFPKLRNLEDFTWLNCDVRTLVYLVSVNSLKRLVLHITKFDQIFFDQFFARFGFDVGADLREPEDNETGRQKILPLTQQRFIHDDPKSFSNISVLQYRTQEAPSLSTSLVQSAFTDLVQEKETGDRVWFSMKPPTKKVHLDYAALSFTYAILQSEECYSGNWSNKVQLPRPERFLVPLVVIKANTVVLNLPPTSHQLSLLNLGSPKRKFSIGFPKEICANIKPNRISYGSVVQILESGPGMFVEEVEIHVMFDYYRKERVIHLFNLAMMKFFPKILRLHFTAAGRSMKKYYKWPRLVSDSTLFLRFLTVFELTLNCLTFHIPNVTSYSSMPELKEVYVTLCGLPHNEHATIRSVMEFFRFFMQPKDNLKTVIFRTNAPVEFF
uniref:F-box domain-containing protein n=1 Tax=Loa loa TaxID=7209 RepID=A0A1I7W3L8_LOALO